MIRPVPQFTVNINASYLHSEVITDEFLVNPRDVSGGRSDAVIVKDIGNGSDCVVPTGRDGGWRRRRR